MPQPPMSRETTREGTCERGRRRQGNEDVSVIPSEGGPFDGGESPDDSDPVDGGGGGGGDGDGCRRLPDDAIGPGRN